MNESSEKIVVIGGGYTGVISSILLSKIKNEDGKPLYDVILLEEKEHLLDGASKIIDRLHLGGEYPLDEKTAIACLEGGLLFKQMIPDVYAEAFTTAYMVSKETEAHGLLTVQKMIQQYRKLQKRYSAYFYSVARHCGQEQAAEKLFGFPDDFFSVLDRQHHVKGFVGGIQTQERIVNPVLLGAFLEMMIQKQGVRVYTNHKVVSTEVIPHGFKVVTTHNHHEGVFEGHQVVNAAWHHAFALNNRVKVQQNKTIYAHLRCTAIVDISGCQEKPGAIFAMLGEYGGTYSPMNDTIAFLYLPHSSGSYLDEAEQNDHCPLCPEIWESIILDGPTDWRDRGKTILNTLKKRFPFLEGARLLSLVARPILSSNSILSKRRHVEVLAIDARGQWLSALSMKATFAPLTALEVVKKIQRNSLKKGTLKKGFVTLPSKKNSPVLPDVLTLSDPSFGTREFLAYARLFAQKRGLPPEMIQEKEHKKAQSSERSPESQEQVETYTDPLHFILIHTRPSLESGISLPGTHVHAIKASLIDTDHSIESDLEPYTLVQHGTMNDLSAGRFDTHLTERDRLRKIGGDAGIASRAIPVKDRMILNDEAIIVNNKGFYGDYQGRGHSFQEGDIYSFLQIFSLKNSTRFFLSHEKNFETLAHSIQKNIPSTDSFAACFVAVMLKKSANSKVIRGCDSQGKPHHTLQEVWGDQRVMGGAQQPEVSHIVNCNGYSNLAGLIFKSSIRAIPIRRFLVADAGGDISMLGGTYRSIKS